MVLLLIQSMSLGSQGRRNFSTLLLLQHKGLGHEFNCAHFTIGFDSGFGEGVSQHDPVLRFARPAIDFTPDTSCERRDDHVIEIISVKLQHAGSGAYVKNNSLRIAINRGQKSLYSPL